jgi:hypothetical protein
VIDKVKDNRNTPLPSSLNLHHLFQVNIAEIEFGSGQA